MIKFDAIEPWKPSKKSLIIAFIVAAVMLGLTFLLWKIMGILP